MPTTEARMIGTRQRFRILMRDGFKCVYCGAQGTAQTLHIDHVHPVSAGGGREDGNLVAACESCNLGKAATVGVIPPLPLDAGRIAPTLVGLYFVKAGQGGNIRGRVLHRDADTMTVELYDWLFGDATVRAYQLADFVGDSVDYYRDIEDFDRRCRTIWNLGWTNEMTRKAV